MARYRTFVDEAGAPVRSHDFDSIEDAETAMQAAMTDMKNTIAYLWANQEEGLTCP